MTHMVWISHFLIACESSTAEMTLHPCLLEAAPFYPWDPGVIIKTTSFHCPERPCLVNMVTWAIAKWCFQVLQLPSSASPHHLSYFSVWRLPLLPGHRATPYLSVSFAHVFAYGRWVEVRSPLPETGISASLTVSPHQLPVQQMVRT